MNDSSWVWPIRFGVFEINPQTGELRKQGLKVRLSKKACKLLLLLLERPGEVRTREELRRQLWSADTLVDFEHCLNKTVHVLREVLDDSAISPRYIETITGQGYRFIPIALEVTTPATSGNLWKIESVAVLPLAVEAGDRELELANRNIVEKIIDTLSQVPRVRVLAYSTVQRYRDMGLDTRTLGQNLHVQAVMAGEMVRCNDALMLHVELIEVDDGTQLWGAQFKEPYSDVLALPEKLADVICLQLRLVISRYLSRRRATKTKHAA